MEGGPPNIFESNSFSAQETQGKEVRRGGRHGSQGKVLKKQKTSYNHEKDE